MKDILSDALIALQQLAVRRLRSEPATTKVVTSAMALGKPGHVIADVTRRRPTDRAAAADHLADIESESEVLEPHDSRLRDIPPDPVADAKPAGTDSGAGLSGAGGHLPRPTSAIIRDLVDWVEEEWPSTTPLIVEARTRADNLANQGD